MATYVLIHGAGSDSWYWHLVAPELQQARAGTRVPARVLTGATGRSEARR